MITQHNLTLMTNCSRHFICSILSLISIYTFPFLFVFFILLFNSTGFPFLLFSLISFFHLLSFFVFISPYLNSPMYFPSYIPPLAVSSLFLMSLSPRARTREFLAITVKLVMLALLVSNVKRVFCNWKLSVARITSSVRYEKPRNRESTQSVYYTHALFSENVN